MKKFVSVITDLVLGGLILVLMVVSLGAIFSAREAPFGIRVFMVQSGSMEPTLKVGSMVVTKPERVYTPGEMITFLSQPNASLGRPSLIITHRITSLDKVDDGYYYQTRGDANQGNDPDLVNSSQVLGKVVLHLPYLGYLISYARTRTGFMLLIVLPAAVMILQELINIKKEVVCLVSARKKVNRINEEV